MATVKSLFWRVVGVALLAALLSPFPLALFGAISGADLSAYLQQLLSGTAVGCVYALVALGIVLIYKATETINFAQGELLMVGAFLAFTFVSLWGLNFWLGVLLAVLAGAVFGMVSDRLVIRPVVGEPVFAIVLVTLGLGYVIRAGVGMVPGWGVDTYAIETPFSGKSLSFAGLSLAQDHVAVIVMTALMCGALFAFFRYTKLGLAMQAASQNQLAAYYMGIPVKTIFTMIWGLSAGVAAIAGLLLAPIAFVHTQMGYVVFKAFPAAVLGGFGSIPGAIVGGLIIGIIESLSGFYLPEGFKDVAAYVVLLAVLLVKPEGLFGVVRRKKV